MFSFKSKKFYILWLFIVNTITTNSQSYYKSYIELIESAKPKTSFDLKVDSLMLLSLENKDIFSYREIAHRYAIYLYKKKQFSRAIEYTSLEIENFEKNSEVSVKYTNALYARGRFYFYNYQYEKAIIDYRKVIFINNNVIRTGQSFSEIGRCYHKMGNYSKSALFFRKGISLLEGNKSYKIVVNQIVNYSLVLKDIGSINSIKEAITVLEKADSISYSNPISLFNRIGLLNELATLYTVKSLYNFEKSRTYYKVELEQAMGSKYVKGIVQGFNNLSYLYNLEKNDSAKYYIEQGLKFADLPESRARLHDNLAEYYIGKDSLKKAAIAIHKSLGIILQSDIKDVPSDYQINQSILKDYTLFCLKKKAEIYLRLYKKYKNKEYLIELLDNIETAEYTVALLLNNTNEQDTRMIWRREASQAYLYGSYASHLLGDTQKAFSYMEKNKALLLSEGVLKNSEFANLPRHISEQETAFQKQIYKLENELSKDAYNSGVQDSLFAAKQVYEQYIDSLKTIYPKYFARKIEVEQISLTEVQKELGEKGAVLSYIWNDFDDDEELVVGLIATKDAAKTFEIRNTHELREKLKTYRKLISKPFETKEEQTMFKEVSHQIFELLLPSQELQTLIKGKNLTIIPDGDLQNIPFESLITEEDTYDYLILNGDVNYSYSYSFLKHNEKVDRITEEDFIGYSPSSFEALSLNNLTNSKEEVSNINNELQGRVKLQDTATKEDFLQNSKNSKIIHLATHADVGKNPWIAFSDEKLELHELYTYKNNADLVTLSACNTSLGELAKGEGVLSLARGFFYSGSKSVVSSLWEVNDKSTSKIMTSFYKNLKEGQTKSEAINNAKRSYLRNHSLSEQSPYYWSSFILIGDPGTIDLSSNSYLYLIAFFLLALIIPYYRKK